MSIQMKVGDRRDKTEMAGPAAVDAHHRAGGGRGPGGAGRGPGGGGAPTSRRRSTTTPWPNRAVFSSSPLVEGGGLAVGRLQGRGGSATIRRIRLIGHLQLFVSSSARSSCLS
jgi:hypothetical protein